MFRELPYGEWREYDPLDALRFYALRMHQLELIERTPEELITECSEWRFLNELKNELKV